MKGAAERKRFLIIPREHGAWGMLGVPLLTGGAVAWHSAGDGGRLAPFVMVALALFWLRTPVESWAGATPVRARTPAELRLVRITSLWLALVALGGLFWLFWGSGNRALVWIGVAAGIAFSLQSILRRRGARTAGQMIGAAGLTSTAAAAYYVVTGRLDQTAWSLWAANLLFAINQIQYVQLRIHAAKVVDRRQKLAMGRGFLVGQAGLVVLIVAACAAGVFHWPAAVAFLPVLVRGVAWFVAQPEPLAIHALGKSELVYACLFGLLIIIGTRLP